MKIHHQQGASVVEFTLIAPVLLMFILLVSEVGIMFYTLNTLTKTTQDAARYLSESKADFAARKLTAESLIQYGNVTNAAPTLLPNTISTTITDEGTHVKVVVTYPHGLILGGALGALTRLTTGGGVNFGSSFNMGASSVMRFAQ